MPFYLFQQSTDDDGVVWFVICCCCVLFSEITFKLKLVPLARRQSIEHFFIGNLRKRFKNILNGNKTKSK